jgi:imidazolonepropionase-like amidohydrolase
MPSHLITNAGILDGTGREPFAGSVARDLWLFVKILGFSPTETLVAATRLGGELMGLPGELGVVKAGALADLLLVDGDPLADITVLQDRSALRMIMKDGAIHKGGAQGRV